MAPLHSFLMQLERTCLAEQFLFYRNVFLSNRRPLSFAGLLVQRDRSGLPEDQRQNEGVRNRGITMPVAGALLWGAGEVLPSSEAVS